MLLIRPTKSLAKKLQVTPVGPDSTSLAPNSFNEWYCNDFKFERTDLAIFVNPATFLPLVLKAAPYRTLVDRFREELPQYLKRLGYPELALNIGNEVQFTKTNDRSTIGVMTQFLKELACEDHLGRIQLDDTLAMSTRLGSTLIGGPNYQTPLERLAARVGSTETQSRKKHLRLVT